MSVNEAKRNAVLAARARQRGMEAWELEMIETVPTDVIADFVSDYRSYSGRPSSIIPPTPSRGPSINRSNNGWVDVPLPSTPPGQRYVDAMLDAQDVADRAELTARLARARVATEANAAKEELARTLKETSPAAQDEAQGLISPAAQPPRRRA